MNSTQTIISEFQRIFHLVTDRIPMVQKLLRLHPEAVFFGGLLREIMASLDFKGKATHLSALQVMKYLKQGGDIDVYIPFNLEEYRMEAYLEWPTIKALKLTENMDVVNGYGDLCPGGYFTAFTTKDDRFTCGIKFDVIVASATKYQLFPYDFTINALTYSRGRLAVRRACPLSLNEVVEDIQDRVLCPSELPKATRLHIPKFKLEYDLPDRTLLSSLDAQTKTYYDISDYISLPYEAGQRTPYQSRRLLIRAMIRFKNGYHPDEVSAVYLAKEFENSLFEPDPVGDYIAIRMYGYPFLKGEKTIKPPKELNERVLDIKMHELKRRLEISKYTIPMMFQANIWPLIKYCYGSIEALLESNNIRDKNQYGEHCYSRHDNFEKYLVEMAVIASDLTDALTIVETADGYDRKRFQIHFRQTALRHNILAIYQYAVDHGFQSTMDDPSMHQSCIKYGWSGAEEYLPNSQKDLELDLKVALERDYRELAAYTGQQMDETARINLSQWKVHDHSPLLKKPAPKEEILIWFLQNDGELYSTKVHHHSESNRYGRTLDDRETLFDLLQFWKYYRLVMVMFPNGLDMGQLEWRIPVNSLEILMWLLQVCQIRITIKSIESFLHEWRTDLPDEVLHYLFQHYLSLIREMSKNTKSRKNKYFKWGKNHGYGWVESYVTVAQRAMKKRYSLTPRPDIKESPTRELPDQVIMVASRELTYVPSLQQICESVLVRSILSGEVEMEA